jgi:CRISPR-associated protein Cas1
VEITEVAAPAANAAKRPTSHLVAMFGEALDRVLIVDERGSFVGKTSERLRVSSRGQTLKEAPLFDLEHVLLASEGVSISTDAISACAEAGIPIDIISARGEPRACMASAALGATVRTRREQLRAFDDARGAALASGFAAAKLTSQARLIRYMAKYRKESQPSLFSAVMLAAGGVEAEMRAIRAIQGESADAVRQQILMREGRGSARYWQAAHDLLPEEMDWHNRETRGAEDPVNSALNYGYGILYSMVQRAILLAGLDPYAGYLHVDRPGKPSLVLDLIEEFRQAVVDRCIFALCNQGSTLEVGEDSLLTLPTRREIIRRIEARLEAPERYDGKRYPLRIILQMQARRLASYLRGDAPAYASFTGRFS